MGLLMVHDLYLVKGIFGQMIPEDLPEYFLHTRQLR